MIDKSKFLGCFVSCQATVYDLSKSEMDRLAEQEFNSEQCRLFRTYIWGDEGIDSALKKLKYDDYGEDLVFILFQFYVNPLQNELQNLKEIESYRAKEKSIGIPIIITNANFFSQSESVRYSLLRQSILQKMDILTKVVKKKRLDTKVEKLAEDLRLLF